MRDWGVFGKSRFKLGRHWTIAIALSLLALVVSWLYVACEHTFYWTDFVVYQNRAIELLLQFQDSWNAGVSQVLNSLETDYNLLYTLPLLPILSGLGMSRSGYILAVTLSYLLPFCLAVSFINTQICQDFDRKKLAQKTPEAIAVSPSTFRRDFAVFLAIALLVPMTWIPTLRGFPDTGGMLGVVAAAGLYLRGRRRLWRFAAMGVLLALAVLLRRHFAYAGLAVGGAIAVCGLADVLLAARRGRQRNAINTGLQRLGELLLMAVAGLLVLVAVAPEFTQRAATGDYRSAYSSFSFPIPDTLHYFGSAYGYLTWGLVVWGAWRGRRGLSRRTWRFWVAWGGLAIAAQVLVLRYDSVHYTLHVTPFVIWGLTVLWRSLSSLPRNLLLGYLLLNFLLGLTPLGGVSFPGRRLFAANYPPLVRRDYAELVRLVDALDEFSRNDAPIYLISASDTLNRGLVRNAHWERHRPETRPPNCHIPCSIDIVGIPTADSNSIYPLEPILAAEYVVVASPVQYHLQREEQEVVIVPQQAFTEGWAIADDFETLPRRFTLQDKSDNDVTVSVHRRIRPTSWQTAVRTLARMEREFRDRPGLQSDWVNLTPHVSLDGQYSGRDPVQLDATDVRQPLHLLYIGDFDPQTATLQTQLQADCPLTATASLVTAEGERVSPPQPLARSPLTWNRPAGDYLHLTLTPQGTCSISLQDLTVRDITVRDTSMRDSTVRNNQQDKVQ